MKSWKIILALLTFVSVVLSGCQQESAENPEVKPDTTKQAEQAAPAGEYGVPYSNGPSSLPEESMTGPTAPPPETPTPSAQAITTKENIRLTLPRKVE